MEIEVGQKVGWHSDVPYFNSDCIYGIVVARSGDNLSILNEKLAEKHPHINPFANRKVYHVWIVD